MPELPDITVYQEALERFVVGQTLESVVVRSPFVLRTFDPEISACDGKIVNAVSRLGKRIVWELSDDLWVVFHLMITGRFHWKKPSAKPSRKVDLAAFRFETGTLMLTEAGTKKRASIHVHRGRAALAEHDRGGLDVLTCTVDEFAERLNRRNRTIKKALVDPLLFDGIGNAYSDEILHAAKLSPIQWTTRLSNEQVSRLLECCRRVLTDWTDRLRTEVGTGFPEKVTAFHKQMAVHGKYGQACPECDAPVQRIVSAEREFNYCPGCQTNGRILKDRSLSRLLKDDWPDTVDDLPGGGAGHS